MFKVYIRFISVHFKMSNIYLIIFDTNISTQNPALCCVLSIYSVPIFAVSTVWEKNTLVITADEQTHGFSHIAWKGWS